MKKKILIFIVALVSLAVIISVIAGLIYFVADQLKEQTPDLSPQKPFKLIGQVNKKNIDIGEPFEYVVTLFKLKNAKVKLEKLDPVKDKDKFKNLEVDKIEEHTKNLFFKDMEIIRNVYHLQPKDFTDVEIPSIVAKSPRVKSTLPVVKIEPKTVLDNINQMKDINDIKPLDKFFILNIWYIIIPLIATILIILIIFLLVKYARRPQVKEEPVVYKPPHVIAYEELAKLKHAELNTYEDMKIYYTKLADVLRIYLEGRFNISAIERTSEEIISDLVRIKLNMKTRNLAKSILRQSDLVKFAKQTTTKELAYCSLEKTYQFVENTKQEVQVTFD